jgi:hypothetical protein
MSLKNAMDRVDRKVAESTGEEYGSFIAILLPLLQIFLPMLANLPCLAPKPAPPNPDPSPSPEAAKAWNDAWILKSKAVEAFDDQNQDYNRHTLNVMAGRILRAKRRADERIKRPEALELARAALDEARERELPEMVDIILEAQAK